MKALGKGKRNCQKGKSCGSSCISRKLICRKDAPTQVSKSLSKAKGQIEKVKESRRGKGQSLDGENLDIKRLVERVNTWTTEHGLEGNKLGKKGPGYNQDFQFGSHDAIHVLMRDYLGKTSEQIGKLGKGGGKGPSVMEELIVQLLEGARDRFRYPPDNLKKEFRDYLSDPYVKMSLRTRVDSFIQLGFINKNSPEYVGQDKIINRTLKLVGAMSNRGDFGDFISTMVQSQDKMAEFLKGVYSP